MRGISYCDLCLYNADGACKFCLKAFESSQCCLGCMRSYVVICVSAWQMALSKRSIVLGREHAGQASAPVARSRHSPVAQWRVEHGFTESPDPDHACKGKCAFVNVVDNVYLCENCGREHVCDDQCKERVLDTANGMPVCPISGMCFDQLDNSWEVGKRTLLNCTVHSI